MAVEDLRSKGVSPVYLLTDHTGFYERYGWETRTAATDGKFDWNMGKAAGRAVKAAVDAQSDLADQLRRTINDAHGGQASVLLDEAVLQCDRRACEIQTLVCEFADLNAKAGNVGPEVQNARKGDREHRLRGHLQERRAIRLQARGGRPHGLRGGVCGVQP